MFASALGHRLETLQDGLTTFCQGAPVPMPLVGTEINVRVIQGLAIVRTFRSFRNVEDTPIEAIMTFPVGFDAVVTSLVATIDGRRMIGTAKEKTEARETYEAALDEGRLSVLHEEVLRGIHVLSIGALPPGAEVAVELEQVVPLADAGGTLFLRLPMTAGQIYGTSPLLPSDDLVTASGVRHSANLIVTTDTGCVIMNGQAIAGDTPLPILLDRAIELRIEGGTLGKLSGRDADGRTVELPETSFQRRLQRPRVADMRWWRLERSSQPVKLQIADIAKMKRVQMARKALDRLLEVVAGGGVIEQPPTNSPQPVRVHIKTVHAGGPHHFRPDPSYSPCVRLIEQPNVHRDLRRTPPQHAAGDQPRRRLEVPHDNQGTEFRLIVVR